MMRAVPLSSTGKKICAERPRRRVEEPVAVQNARISANRFAATPRSAIPRGAWRERCARGLRPHRTVHLK